MNRTFGITLAIFVAGFVTLACQAKVVVDEPQYEPDVARLCGLYCDLRSGCGYPSEVDDCASACFESDPWWVPCNREYEVAVECLVGLSCEESDLIEGGELRREEEPCGELRLQFSNCHSENLPDDWGEVQPPED